MGGGHKDKGQQINSGPYSIAEPAFKPLAGYLGGGQQTTFSSMPGQLEAIASQLSSAYPAMPRAALMKELQTVYKPVTSGQKPAPKKAAATTETTPRMDPTRQWPKGTTYRDVLLSGGHTPSGNWFRNNPTAPGGADWDSPWIPFELRPGAGGRTSSR